MSTQRPIATAPKDGTKITVYWTDRDGQESESIAQYRSLARLQAAGGQWDGTDEGWWAYVDSDTQKRIAPHSWSAPGDDDEDE